MMLSDEDIETMKIMVGRIKEFADENDGTESLKDGIEKLEGLLKIRDDISAEQNQFRNHN